MPEEITTIGDLIEALSKCNSNDKVERHVGLTKDAKTNITYLDIHVFGSNSDN